MDIATQARTAVLEYYNKRVEKTDIQTGVGKLLHIDDVYIVWQVKVLQNWKALVSTNVMDGCYYEATYDGDAEALYLDKYIKFDNIAIPLPR